MKPLGLFLNNNTAPIMIHNSIITTNLVCLILLSTPRVYLAVTRSNQPLNAAKALSSQFFFLCSSCGFSISVHNAGVNDNATNADINTDIAIVMANCWYNRPTIPG